MPPRRLTKPGLFEADKLANSNSVVFALAKPFSEGPQSAASCVPPSTAMRGAFSGQFLESDLNLVNGLGTNRSGARLSSTALAVVSGHQRGLGRFREDTLILNSGPMPRPTEIHNELAAFPP